ncbi:MAG TPA: LysM peptidoglycan-binding domain-containing M23 family metallopeptidase [Xanthobacteraceae bacterium]|nr:LysM peptidoglycan-binding domain-containing M23 family metallopeptidase [Xanthobacteraceae bacterium]
MCAARRSAPWPQLVAISLIGIAVAGCSADSGRFNEGFGPPGPSYSRSDVTGSISQAPPPASHIVSRPLPNLASADSGASGGGRGMGSYQGGGDVTGSVAAPPPPSWTWDGGTAVTVHPGQTVESIAREHGVPVAALREANHIAIGASIHPGEHLVIPRYRPASVAAMPPQTRIASTPPRVAAPYVPPHGGLVAPSGVHVVAPGETLNSIARLYGKPVMVIARANNIPPDTMVRVGEHIAIPEMGEHPAPVVPRAESPVAAPSTVATIESPHSARVATPSAPVPEEHPVKAEQAASAMPSFRWPVRGRIIAGFGPKPNGLQNDGINLAVPEGTPVKAAEDGVVAYAGNELKGYGNLVLIRHANGFVTAYANASELLVKRGETVKRGQVIAKSGETGNVTSPQLHFEIRKGATPVDPSQYLSGA